MLTAHNCSGFTLCELLIVALILGILGAVTAPHFKGVITEIKLNEAAAELVGGLQYARNLAVEYQRPFGIKADTSGNWFRVFDDRYKADANPHHSSDPPVDAYGVVLEPLNKTWYVKTYDTIYKGVKITAVPAGGEIRFYPDGHSAASDHTFLINLDTAQRTITVNGTTGRVSVQ
jgi:prepilin-type N-terminal cleavage/methylation domain-containing protein